MGNLILQRLVPAITAFVVFINSVGGLFGNSAVIPYNPERTDVVVSGEVITDIEKVLDCYNEAVENTGFVLGSLKSDILSDIEVVIDGQQDAPIDLAPFIQAFENTETYIFEVPSNGKILVEDVKSAKMSVKDGKRSIIITIKDYTETMDSYGSNRISRAYGYKGNITEVLGSLNMSFGGYEYTYTDCTISCVIDDNSGKIIYGDWDNTASGTIKNIEVSLFDFETTIDEMTISTRSFIDI